MGAESIRAAVIGAGIGGLCAALELAAAGAKVTVFERADYPGGRMRELPAGPAAVDAGPTVLTMRWIFDELFARTGTPLDNVLEMDALEVLARHAWESPVTLDLFSDVGRSADAIGQFAGLDEARGYREFAERARRAYELLDPVFLQKPAPSLAGLLALPSPARLFTLWRSGPFSTLWKIVGSHFKDPRLQQLFARYATYCGSSPFLAPATLMLIAHVEQLGVWSVRGGMQRLAEALATRIRGCGGRIEFGCEVRRVRVERGRVHSLELMDGRSEGFDLVVANTEPWAVGAGYLGEDVRDACGGAISPKPSLSAVTWTCRARIEGWPLARHNVFFSDDYPAEFGSLQGGRYPADPTIYLCAQDRPQSHENLNDRGERVFMLMNAPARAAPAPAPVALESVAMRRLARAGITVIPEPDTLVRTTPEDFAARFPGSGGALYGMATHGWRAAFARRSAKTRIRGFYLAGGGVHPGAGVPMAALSGRYAASQALSDLGHGAAAAVPASRIRPVVTPS